jgi:tetratricopeptide (TPR) repeat protein
LGKKKGESMLGWFGRKKEQRQAEETWGRLHAQYVSHKLTLLDYCKTGTRLAIDDEQRALRAAGLASNLVTREQHPPELLESINEGDRLVAQKVADDILADPEMHQLAGDALFWLAEAELSKGFDVKTNGQSPESIATAKSLLDRASDLAGTRPKYQAALCQIFLAFETLDHEARKRCGIPQERNGHRMAYLAAKKALASDDPELDALRPELLRLQANAACELRRYDEAEALYLQAKLLAPKLGGIDEALTLLHRKRSSTV